MQLSHHYAQRHRRAAGLDPRHRQRAGRCGSRCSIASSGSSGRDRAGSAGVRRLCDAAAGDTVPGPGVARRRWSIEFLVNRDGRRASPHVAGNSLGGLIALELARRGQVRSANAHLPGGFRKPGPRQRWPRRHVVGRGLAVRAAQPDRSCRPTGCCAREAGRESPRSRQLVGHPTSQISRRSMPPPTACARSPAAPVV